MRILIFGGGGFIGSSIADQLLRKKNFIRIFERPRVAIYRNFSKEEKIEWVTGDFSSAHDVRAALDGIDVVLHLISTTLPKDSNEDPLYDVQTNVVSTLQMLNIMVQMKINRILFISSGGTVYGIPRYLPINEEHPTNPLVSYGITKLTIEKYLMLYAKLFAIRTTILRVSNLYGPRQRIETAQGAVGVFVHRALRGQPIEIWGDGNIIRDYIYISDVVDAFFRAMMYDGVHQILNISSGQGLSLNDLINLIEEYLGRKIDRIYLSSRSFDVPINILNNSLAIRELNWRPQVEIKEGISRVALSMKFSDTLLKN